VREILVKSYPNATQSVHQKLVIPDIDYLESILSFSLNTCWSVEGGA